MIGHAQQMVCHYQIVMFVEEVTMFGISMAHFVEYLLIGVFLLV